jgi:hypothetical protein
VPTDASMIARASALEPVPARRFEKQRDARFGVWRNMVALKAGLHDRERKLPLWPVEEADNTGLQTLPMLKAAESPLLYGFCCFPDPGLMDGEAKKAPRDRSKSLISLRKSGGGEGLRTLDPNLGKVAHAIPQGHQ